MPKISEHLDDLHKRLDRIESNHLTSIYSKLEGHDAKLDWLTWAVRLILGGLVGSILVSIANLALLLNK